MLWIMVLSKTPSLSTRGAKELLREGELELNPLPTVCWFSWGTSSPTADSG